MKPPSFLADVMLARLARWLRALGFDTTWDDRLDDAALVRRAREDDRVLLTRDRHLVTHLRPPRVVLVTSQVPLEQLREVVTACGLQAPLQGRPLRGPLRAPPGLFCRCMLCNALLDRLSPEEVAMLPPDAGPPAGVPAGSAVGPATDAAPLRRCPECRRVYWPGSHTRRMERALARALPEWFR